MSNQCYQCKDRHQGCHGTCEKYKEYRAVMDEAAKVRRTEHLVREIIDGYNPAKRRGIPNGSLRGAKR